MILYKYFEPNRASFLRDRLIRFTPPGSFNDPFDCLPTATAYDDQSLRELIATASAGLLDAVEPKILESAQAVLLQRYSNEPTLLRNLFLIGISRRISQEIGVLCLSANNHSI